MRTFAIAVMSLGEALLLGSSASAGFLFDRDSYGQRCGLFHKAPCPYGYDQSCWPSCRKTCRGTRHAIGHHVREWVHGLWHDDGACEACGSQAISGDLPIEAAPADTDIFYEAAPPPSAVPQSARESTSGGSGGPARIRQRR